MSPSLEARIVDAGLIGDPYFEGLPRFREDPVTIPSRDYEAMCRVAERLVRVHDEAARLIADDDSLLDSFFQLLPCQKLLWHESSPFWHGYARADIFDTSTGFVACELNSDTPTGHAETVALASLVRDPSGKTRDPNEGLAAAHGSMFETYAEARLGPQFPRTAGIVYPTDLTEDLPLVRLFQAWLEGRGFEVVTGSPFNLTLAKDGTASLFETPCSLVVRHYKTDWWTERVPVWLGDPPFDDPLPLAGPLEVLARAELSRKSVVVNPLGAVLTQNKRMLAFFWECFDLFSPESQETISAHVPETLRLESAHHAMLSVEREHWVMKSDYGCEGDEVVLGWELGQPAWDRALALAQAGRWVVQRRFFPRTCGGETTNYGVYVVAGKASGIYVRTHDGATDRHAKSAAAWVSR